MKFRVQYWTDYSHNKYLFDSEMEARTKYLELVTRSILEVKPYDRVVFQVLYDYTPPKYITVLKYEVVG